MIVHLRNLAKLMCFLRLGVMCSGENDACGVTVSLYPQLSKPKLMPDHVGNGTCDR